MIIILQDEWQQHHMIIRSYLSVLLIKLLVDSFHWVETDRWGG